MPKHYAEGQNIQSGTVEIDGRKVTKVFYPLAFTRKPSVTITLEDSGANHTPYRTKVKKTDFRVVFKTPFTGTVGWTAVAV